jgi:hypothetical protein
VERGAGWPRWRRCICEGGGGVCARERGVGGGAGRERESDRENERARLHVEPGVVAAPPRLELRLPRDEQVLVVHPLAAAGRLFAADAAAGFLRAGLTRKTCAAVVRQCA